MSDPSSECGGITPPRITVMGVGSYGARIAGALRAAAPDIDVVVIDTDTRVLETAPVKRVIQVGGSVTNGFSAGGDVELGRQSIEKDSSAIRAQLRRTDLLVIVAGLGGGTGSGAVPVITRIAREAGTLVLCMVSLPFGFEGKLMAKKADEALKRIRTHADAIIRIPNERLIGRSDRELPAEEAFARSRILMEDGIRAVHRLLTENSVCGLDFACLQIMLRNCDGFCHFGSAEAEGAERAGQLAEAILGHSLLNGGKLLSAAAGIIVGLIGGPDLRLSEVETVMNRIRELLPDNAWFNFGLAIDPAAKKRLSAVVLAAEQWKEPLMDDARRQMGFTFNRRLPTEQGELPLETAGKGRFSEVDSTIHSGQDLDVPTYIRRDIRLPR